MLALTITDRERKQQELYKEDARQGLMIVAGIPLSDIAHPFAHFLTGYVYKCSINVGHAIRIDVYRAMLI